jgi:hypothetical protein
MPGIITPSLPLAGAMLPLGFADFASRIELFGPSFFTSIRSLLAAPAFFADLFRVAICWPLPSVRICMDVQTLYVLVLDRRLANGSG